VEAGFAEASKVDRSTVPSLSHRQPCRPAKHSSFFSGAARRCELWKGVQVSLAIDGEWKAILPAKNTYMWFESDPGPLDLCGFGGGSLTNNHGIYEPDG